MPRLSSRYALPAGWALLAASILGRLLWVWLLPNGLNLVDLRVYADGSAALATGDLYDYTYSAQTPDFALPFTYPPFAALVFYPLHLVPFRVLGVVWLIATIAALYAVIRISLTLMLGAAAGAARWRAVAAMTTAVAIWCEPVRTTLDYGQVNVFLVLAAMLAVRSSRWWVSGALVGVVAGIKLTPAIAWVYFAARRRWATVGAAAAVFAGTIGISYLVAGSAAHRYFGTLLGDASRIGPVGSVWNQSLRGALSRIVGHDVGTGPLLLTAVVLVAGLAVLAWRALAPDDRLGMLLVVELFGLMVSPISWSHHWVWLVPLVLWLCVGPYRDRPGRRLVVGYWLVAAVVGMPWLLSFWQESIWLVSRPGLLAWFGAVDAIGVVLFYLWLIAQSRPRPPAATSSRPPAAT